MCGRFSIAKKVEDIEKRFNAEMLVDDWRPNYNAAPTQNLLVQTSEQKDKIKLFRWGLIPFWAKDPAIGNKMINARAETLNSKPAFKSLLKRKRCLVITDGFYEWKKNGKMKQPFRIAMKNNELFTFAGLWDEWKDPEGKEVSSFTIITTEASGLIKPIHHRMPVIFDEENEKTWLDENIVPEDAVKLLLPYHKENLIAYSISTAINSPGNNSIELWNEEGEIEMPGLFD